MEEGEAGDDSGTRAEVEGRAGQDKRTSTR